MSTRIIDRQRQLAEAGKIRFGARKAPNRPGKPIPHPRVTSSRRDLLEQVARIYGGTVVEWDRESGVPTYEVTVERDLTVYVPPIPNAIVQQFELWRGRVSGRFCDGQTAKVRMRSGRWKEEPCPCSSLEKRECKLVTRIDFWIDGVEGTGVFNLVTHSEVATDELVGMAEFAQGSRRPARLSSQVRSRVVVDPENPPKTVTRRYPVPVLEIATTPGELLGAPTSLAGELEAPTPEPGVRQIEPGELPAAGHPSEDDGDELEGEIIDEESDANE